MTAIAAFFQDAYPATDELQCITIYIPDGDEFKWLLAGLLRLPTLADNYQDPDSEQAQGLADIWREGYDLTDWSGCVSENMLTIDLFTVNYDTANSAALTFFTAGFIPFGYTMFSANTAGNTIVNPVWLRAGNYSYIGHGGKSNASGKTDIHLHTATSGIIATIASNIDQYNATFTVRVQATGTFTVPDDGFYNILAMNNGTKNVASGGYAVNWTSHHLVQTS